MNQISNKEKIEKLEALNFQALKELLKSLLEKRGFKDVSIVEDCINCYQKGLLHVSSIVFVTFEYRLGGIQNFDYENFAKYIRKIRDKYSANEVYIYSSLTITQGFKDNANQKLVPLKVNYIGRNELINLVDEVFPEYWRHEDLILAKYEKAILSSLDNDNELKKLKLPQENYSKLFNIFIEPSLLRYYEDEKTRTLIQRKYSVSELIGYQHSLIIDGQAGAGKSTLLKQLVKKQIESNSSIKAKKYYPIYLTSIDIFNADFNISNAIRNATADYTEMPLSELVSQYDVQLFIDSIDEFEEEMESILKELSLLESKYKIKFYIASRNADILIRKSTTPLDNFSIKRFDLTQIKLFLNAFFSGDETKTSYLLDAIRENQMLDKMPITPLTLSLISILFEENEFEVPATVSDIFDNFNTLVIGKAVVSSKVELIDTSFKERILSIYALELMKTPGHIPFKKDQFLQFFENYYKGKSLPIKKGTLEDVLLYLLQNTGIIYLKEGNIVQFAHDAYMEYYAALEIFKHRRAEEDCLVENFYDPNWQNSAVFYGGMSKDMPDFLEKIQKKLHDAANFNDYMAGILGAGYILQALYQTDNKLRKNVIFEALELSLKNLQVFKIMAANDIKLFKNYKLPILNLINFVYFYESFNSVTLGEPLRMAFDEVYPEYIKYKDPSLGYNLIELAFTMDSKRINNQEPLEKLVFETPDILKEINLNNLLSFSMTVLGKDRYKEELQELKKASLQLIDVQKEFVALPMEKMRFSAMDTIRQHSNVTLLVEGKTDAVILEVAFMALTGGSMPYWKVNCAGSSEGIGSCEQVAKTLTQTFALWKGNPNDIVIGLFDHDNAGLGAYRGLLYDRDFKEIEHDSVKKHKNANIYGLCIPVPGEMEHYLKSRQVFNFFEIEHYFGYEYLQEHHMLKETELDNIYEIADGTGVKSKFANSLKSETQTSIFRHFVILFEKIDKITGIHINYEY